MNQISCDVRGSDRLGHTLRTPAAEFALLRGVFRGGPEFRAASQTRKPKAGPGSSCFTLSRGEHFVASAAWLLSFLAVFLLAPRQTCPTTSQDGKSRWAPKNLRKGAKDLPEGHPQKCAMTRTWRKAEDAWGWANEGKSNQMRSDPTETGPRNQVPDTHPALRAGTRFPRVNRVIAPTGYRAPRAGPEMFPHKPSPPPPCTRKRTRDTAVSPEDRTSNTSGSCARQVSAKFPS